MILLIVAIFGLVVPNGLFIYWATTEFNSMSDLFASKLALAFMIDAMMVVALLAFYFAKHPVGKWGWKTFVLLSFVGGLGFSLPLYWWMKSRQPHPGQ